MKKIILILLSIFLFAGCFSQNTVSRIRFNNLTDYPTSAEYGDIVMKDSILRTFIGHNTWAFIGKHDTIWMNDSTFIVNHPSEGYFMFYRDDTKVMELTKTTDGAFLAVDGTLRLVPVDSASTLIGAIYIDEDDSTLYMYNGTEWQDLTSGGGLEVDNPPASGLAIVTVDPSSDVVLVDFDTLVYELDTVRAGDINQLFSDTIFYAKTGSFENLVINSDTVVIKITESVAISSSNILNGDSILCIQAPGSGKLLVIEDVVTYFNYNSVAYASGNTSYIKTFQSDGSTSENLMGIAAALFTNTSDKISQSNDDNGLGNSWTTPLVGNERGLNQPIWFQIGSGFTTGNSTAVMKIVYYILNFN